MGSDSFADLLTKQLEGSSVNFSALQVGPGASGMSVAIVEASGEYGAAVVSGENTNINETLIKIPENTGVLLLQNEISETVNLEIAKKAKAAGCKVWLNAAPAKKINSAFFSLVDICIVNRVEAEFYNFINSNKTHKNLTIIKTLGHEGLELIEPSGKIRKIPAFKVNPISSHGAGDMFIGALAARYLIGDTMENALVYSQAAAALFISRAEEERAGINQRAVTDFMENNL